MGLLWFLVATVFFILWIRAKPSNPRRTEDTEATSYDEGYWDGYRAFGKKLLKLNQTNAIDTHAVKDLIDASFVSDDEQPSDEQPDSATEEITTADVLEESAEYAPELVEQPILTPEQTKAEKEQRTVRNLNTLLYVGSFLIVAAAALFVTLTMPPLVKLLALMFVTAAFYLSGLSLYAHSQPLRPAAQAFTGTGLAILPFIGFALTSLGGFSSASAWFITSVVGLLAYTLAAVRLQNQLVSYITMAFILSLAMSAVSTLGLSILWYFIVVIGVSLLCNSIHFLYPKRVPDIFSVPLEQTGQVTTPIALIASLFVGQHTYVFEPMNIFMYEVLFGIATAHYLVVWLEHHSLFHETIVRILAHITLLIVACDVSGLSHMTSTSQITFGIWWLSLALLQSIYSLIRARQPHNSQVRVERIWTAVSLGTLAVGISWWPHEHWATWVSLSLGVIGAIALGTTLRFRQVYWAYVGLAVSVLLPFTIGRGMCDPTVSYEVLAISFAVLAALALIGFDRAATSGRSQPIKNMLIISIAVYGLFVTFSGILSSTMTTIGWTTLLTSGIFVALSYAIRAPIVEMVGAVFGATSVAAWVHEASIGSQWQLLTWAVVATTLLIAAAAVHHFNAERIRRDGLIGIATTIFALIVFSVGTDNTTVLRTATVLLTIAGVTAMASRFVQKQSESPLAIIAQASYGVFPLLALMTAWQVGEGWISLVLIAAAVIFWLASYRETLPTLLLVGNILLFVSLNTTWSWLAFDAQWQIHGTAWIAAIAFYAMYWLMVNKRDSWRQLASLASIWTVLSLSTLTGMSSSEQSMIMAAVGSLLGIAATLAIQGYLEKKSTYIEVAAYIATFSLQRMVACLIPDINMVFYAHWWALVIALIAYWRKENYKIRIMIALAFVTGSTGIYALQGTPGYSLIFLIEHLAVLVAGATMRQQWAMWWGIVAVVVAILYFLRDYTFLALLFLGFIIILFVIWRLGKMSKNSRD